MSAPMNLTATCMPAAVQSALAARSAWASDPARTEPQKLLAGLLGAARELGALVQAGAIVPADSDPDSATCRTAQDVLSRVALLASGVWRAVYPDVPPCPQLPEGCAVSLETVDRLQRRGHA